MAADYLSSSKRKFIERWRKSVDNYMTKGNLCKKTIADVPPENDGVITPSSERSRSRASYHGLPTESSSHFPVIPHAYTRSGYDIKSQKNIYQKNGDKLRVRLPPSPNGMLVRSGTELHAPWFLQTFQKPDENTERPSVVNNSKDLRAIGQNSSKIAKEIFDKYNMKSDSQNTLPGKHIYNGFQQFSMPWRNKTFLTLPVRLNGNIRMKNAKYLDSEQLSISSGNADFGSNVSLMSWDGMGDFGDWTGGE